MRRRRHGFRRPFSPDRLRRRCLGDHPLGFRPATGTAMVCFSLCIFLLFPPCFPTPIIRRFSLCDPRLFFSPAYLFSIVWLCPLPRLFFLLGKPVFSLTAWWFGLVRGMIGVGSPRFHCWMVRVLPNGLVLLLRQLVCFCDLLVSLIGWPMAAW